MINVKVEKLPYDYTTTHERLMGDSIKKSNSSNGFMSMQHKNTTTTTDTTSSTVGSSFPYMNGNATGGHKRKCLSDTRTNNYEPGYDDNSMGKKLKTIAINKENRKMSTSLNESSIKAERNEHANQSSRATSPALSTSPTLSSLSSSASSVDSSLSSSPLAFLHGLSSSSSMAVNEFLTPSSFSSLNYLNLLNRPGGSKQDDAIKLTLSSSFKVNYSTQGAVGEPKNTQFKLKNNYVNNFLHNLKDYIQSQPFDTCLVVNRTNRVKAHRIVLVAGSDFFRKYFENQPLNRDTDRNSTIDSIYKKDHADERLREICLDDECLNDFELFRACIDFMYSMGVSFHLPKQSLLKLKRIAQYLQLNDLVNLIANLLQHDDYLNLLQQQQQQQQQQSTTVTAAQLMPSSFAIPPQHASIPAAMLQLAAAVATTSSSSAANPAALNDFYAIFLKQIYENTLKQTPTIQPTELSRSTPNSTQLQQRPTQSIPANVKPQHKKSTPAEQLIKFEPNLKLKLADMVRIHKRPFEIDTLTRDLLIKDKYVYPSMLNSENELSVINQQLDKCFENYLYINMDNYTNQLQTSSHGTSSLSSSNDFQRHTIILFSLSVLNETSFQLNNNFLIKAKLNFTDLNVLKEDLLKILEFFLNRVFLKCIVGRGESDSAAAAASEETQPADLNNLMRIIVNRVCYLKKPSNCKTIKLETIKSSTDCFRAIVEYSRLNELNELPYVLLTTHSTVYFN